MNNKSAKDLLDRYKLNEATEEERSLVETWFAKVGNKTIDFTEDQINDAQEHVFQKLQHDQMKPSVFSWRKMSIAASILVVFSWASYFIITDIANHPVANHAVADIQPAANVATLILANGHQVILTKLSKYKTINQGSLKVIVAAQMLKYSASNADQNNSVGYNTLITKRGQLAPYGLILCDGTKVWLNAASSITYPVAFNKNERKVTVSGEAYFEVIHDAKRPFKVCYKNNVIEDIGTSFNVEAYDDEDISRTTLLSGSVRLSNDFHHVILKPGQQASEATNTSLFDIKEQDVDNTISWRKGYLSFDHENLSSVLRTISRLYNVTFEYAPGQKINANFWGTISCETKISVLLRYLEKSSHIKFTISGNKIFVSNY